MTPRELFPHLYVSGHTRGLQPHQTLAILAEHEITRIVCLAPQEDRLVALGMRNLGMRYDHIPLSDGKVTQVSVVRSLARELVLDLVTRRVLLHCNAGRNRSPFIAALVMIYSGVLPIDAIMHIRRHRETALANQYFIDFLLKENAQ
jgi:protein-tyrosine phosphatase